MGAVVVGCDGTHFALIYVRFMLIDQPRAFA